MQPDQLAQLQQFSARMGGSPMNSGRSASGSNPSGGFPGGGLNRGLSEKFGDKLTESKKVYSKSCSQYHIHSPCHFFTYSGVRER